MCLSSLCVGGYRVSSGHEIDMLLVHPILRREQTLDIVIRAGFPSLVSLLLLCKDFGSQRGGVLIFDIGLRL